MNLNIVEVMARYASNENQVQCENCMTRFRRDEGIDITLFIAGSQCNGFKCPNCEEQFWSNWPPDTGGLKQFEIHDR